MFKEESPESIQDKQGKTRILIVEGYPLMRQALKSGIGEQQDFEVIAEACGEKDSMPIVATLRPEIALVSIDSFASNGLDCVKKIKKTFSDIKILAMRPFNSPYNIIDIMKAGANGYVDKTESLEVILLALRTVISERETFFKPFSYNYFQDLSEETDQENGSSSQIHEIEKLSERELSILRYMAVGLSNKDIASKLNLSIPSIKLKVSNILTKLHASSRTEAVSRGILLNILTIKDFYP